jgi:hypothetical protein
VRDISDFFFHPRKYLLCWISRVVVKNLILHSEGSTNFFLRQFLHIETFHKYPKENHSNIDMIFKPSWIFHWNSFSQ